MKSLFYEIVFALTFAVVYCNNPSSLPLPSGSELILRTPYSASFSCEGRSYGFYADPGNNCQVFHVCAPVVDDAGTLQDTLQFSFLCGNQTAFNQEYLTCDHADEVDCNKAESFYYKNDDFGKLSEVR